MRQISRRRFDSLAAYCRHPLAMEMSEELAWFEFANESVLATIILDDDGDFAGMILARDLTERFRWIADTGFFPEPEQALYALHRRVAELLPNLDEQRKQGDETGRVVDFFTPVVSEDKLHANFRALATSDRFLAARAIIDAMMRWHEDIDGNFVEQFQTTGFDARIWELYLFAALTEAGLKLERPSPAPDFLACGIHGEFALEATTINPSVGADGKPLTTPRPHIDQETDPYLLHYLPIRYAGPLTAKLKKEYWNSPAVSGRPLVFAIQDFHDIMSMTYSGSALATYLYGYTFSTRYDDDGKLTVVPEPIKEHVWGAKTVPTGFFTFDGAENISAVIFNSSGTISKFNRMGVSAGFGADNIILIRRGLIADPDPDASVPLPFVHIVCEEYPETWIEGLDVFHNPNALHPLDPNLLPGAAHHRLVNGLIETAAPEWKPIASRTMVLSFPGDPTATSHTSAGPSGREDGGPP